MERLKLTIAYKGTLYAGWQIQARGQKKATIQLLLENVLHQICGTAIRVHGAGRTDSGVHADGQVAHVDVPAKNLDWRHTLNALLPKDIRVMRVDRVSSDFHSRYSAQGKLYAYSLYMGKEPVPPRIEPYVWHTPELDTATMEAVAAILVGRHDYATFQNAGTPVSDTVRTVWDIRREKRVIGAMACPVEWPVATWFFHGQGFLKQMVRNLMGLLVHAGLGKCGPDEAGQYLRARNRQALPCATAPAKGLTLSKVEY